MHVEQRHVTTVNLLDGRARDFVVVRDPHGCKVSCVTRDAVLHVLLSYQDFQRLCQTVLPPDGGEDVHKDHATAITAAPPELAPAVAAAPASAEDTIDWLGFN
jgi:hypothetical protein